MTRSSGQLRSHAQKFYRKIKNTLNPDLLEIRNVLKTNLRSMKKEERIAHKEEKRDKIVQPIYGLTNSQFREKYTLLPYQKVFSTQKVQRDAMEVQRSSSISSDSDEASDDENDNSAEIIL